MEFKFGDVAGFRIFLFLFFYFTNFFFVFFFFFFFLKLKVSFNIMKTRANRSNVQGYKESLIN
jgi:hypothetical protein